MSFLHEQYESDGRLVVFECDRCGFVSLSLGSLHAHIESNQSFRRFLQRLAPIVGKDYIDPLMRETNVLRVEETDAISLEEVEGL